MRAKRITEHMIIEGAALSETVSITVDGKAIEAIRGESIAAALLANGIRVHRYTEKSKEPRGIYCAIGQCTDCIMVVNGVPNVRTCITAVEEGMTVETQSGPGNWNP
jgi:predicted molibdopterin-dependent oxidoreductase YjgC